MTILEPLSDYGGFIVFEFLESGALLFCEVWSGVSGGW